jgi:undecaprenyl-diphosphatase
VLASLIAGTLVTFPLKLAIMRPRPFLTIPDIVPFGVEAGSSFPSGHAVRAFAFAFVMSRLRPKLKILLYLFAGLIAFSRIYLGQHYPFDVFAGILIGVLAGCFTVNNQGKILKTISGLGIAADS